ncbi:MAG TPA: radical SAM protein [Candidatus Omnitrophota bacterium]|nr:radical SAM protein [Candidatus Omnitrophota bacterium]
MILINPSSKDTLRLFQPFLPRWIPIGIGYLMAFLEREGITPHYIDEQIEDRILPRIAETIARLEKPYIFGFSVLTASFKRAIELSKILKTLYPDSIILFGNIHPTALPEESLAYDHVDFVLSGESERTLPELYRCLKNGSPVSHIPNLSRKQSGKIIHNQRLFPHDDLSDYPLFPYHLFSPESYDLGFIMSSRGCPFKCIFCSNRIVTGLKFRFRPAEAVFEELELLGSRYHLRNISFLDDSFLIDRNKVCALLKGIREKELHKKMRFDCQARADNIDAALLQELRVSGFDTISFGLEAATDDVLKTIKKGETSAQMADAVRQAKQAGFKIRATFIFGLPGDSRENRMASVRMDQKLKLDVVRYNNATPFPGTELYEIAKKQNRLNVKGLWENFNSVSLLIENPFKPTPFSYVPPGSTEAEIRRDLLYAYFASYARFRRIWDNLSVLDFRPGKFRKTESLLKRLGKFSGYCVLAVSLFVKLVQFFYYSVIKRETAVSFRFFLSAFSGLTEFKDRPNPPGQASD